MHIRTAILIVIAVCSGTAYAQVCSGGAQGGMDATGNQCSSWVEHDLAAPAAGHTAVAQPPTTLAPKPALFKTVPPSADTVALAGRYGYRLPAPHAAFAMLR